MKARVLLALVAILLVGSACSAKSSPTAPDETRLASSGILGSGH